MKWFGIQTGDLHLRHHEATPLGCLIMESVVRPFIFGLGWFCLSSPINSKPLTADQQEKIHAAFLCPRASSKNNVVHPHYTDSPIAMHVRMSSSSRFLHQRAGSISLKVKEGIYQIMLTNALFAMYYTCRKRGVKIRYRKERHTVLHENTHLCFSIPEIPLCPCWWNQIKRKRQGLCQSTKKVINSRVKAQTQFQTPLSMLCLRPTIIVTGVSHYLHSHLPVSVSKSTLLYRLC